MNYEIMNSHEHIREIQGLLLRRIGAIYPTFENKYGME